MKWRGKRKYKKQTSFKYTRIRIFLLIALICVGVWTAVDKCSLSKESVPKVSTNRLIEQQKKRFIQSLIPKAQILNREYKVRASIIIAQAVLESDYGRSKLASTYHNLFGVKEFGEGPSVELNTKEFKDGNWVEIKDKFKVYPSVEASMEDHTQLLVNGVSWDPHLYQEVRTAVSYQEAATALQQSGYATDPDYADKLIKLIKDYQLAKYDV